MDQGVNEIIIYEDASDRRVGETHQNVGMFYGKGGGLHPPYGYSINQKRLQQQGLEELETFYWWIASTLRMLLSVGWENPTTKQE